MTTADTESRAREQARAQYESIAAMVAAYELDWDRLEELRDERESSGFASRVLLLREKPDATIAPDGDWWEDEYPDNAEELEELEAAAGDYESRDDVYTAIVEDALSVEVRSDWCSPGEDLRPGEFRILLCTGGPAVQIVGELDERGNPYRATLQYQDWFEPWQDYYVDRDVLLAYCRHYIIN